VTRHALARTVLLIGLVGAACRSGTPDAPADAAVMDRAVTTPAVDDAPLQVAVHDLIEAAGPDVSIRVCRALADRRVTLAAAPPRPLRDVLDALAAQAGGTVVLAAVPPDGPPLPTIRCQGPASDYMVIGTRRYPNGLSSALGP
jgi:hypothetical protein